MNPYDSCEVSSVFLIKRTFFFFTLLQLRIVNSNVFLQRQ